MNLSMIQMKIETPSDWYRVTLEDIESKGGLSIIHHSYNGSLATALQTIYPEHSLSWYRFQKVPRGYWEDINNVRSYLQYLADQYCLSNINDWMYLTESQIPKFHIIKKHHGGLPELLQKLFPDHKLSLHVPRQSKAQLFLSKMLQTTLNIPPSQLEHNYKHPTLLHKNSNRHMEFDIFVKPFNMVVEYHGPHHYHWWYLNGDPSKQMKVLIAV